MLPSKRHVTNVGEVIKRKNETGRELRKSITIIHKKYLRNSSQFLTIYTLIQPKHHTNTYLVAQAGKQVEMEGGILVDIPTFYMYMGLR